MLSKLIKYEWKNVWRVETILAGIVAAFALVEAVMLQTPMYANLFLDNKNLPDSLEGLSIASVFFGALFLVMLIFGVRMASFIYLGVRFYRSMYCDEGYLTHTLPVTKKELLGAKLLVGVLWQFLINIAVFLSVGAIFASITTIAMRNGLNFNEVMDRYVEIYTDFLDFGSGAFFHSIFTGIFTGLLDPFIGIATIYGSITLGQLFKKNRGLLGVVFYFVITFVVRFVLMIFKGLGNISLISLLDSSSSDFSSYMNRQIFFSYDMKIIVNLIVAVALIVISHNIIEQKLNLH